MLNNRSLAGMHNLKEETVGAKFGVIDEFNTQRNLFAI